MSEINKVKDKINLTEEDNMLLTSVLVQFDTLVHTHADERDRLAKHFKQIIIGLIIAIVILLAGVIGGFSYMFLNFDIGIIADQDNYTYSSGSSLVEDGIHINTDK